MPDLQLSRLREDELEALRLCDLEGLDQESAGERMGVSRGTVQRLLKSGRETLIRALVENRALLIGGDSMEEKGTKTL
jgi:RNA polymerase sigma factor (sigma-70 family)